MKRKSSKLLVLAMATILAIILVVPVQAKTPLVGIMDLEFNLAWSGPSTTIPEWEGTITIDDTEYDMLFFNIGTGKQGNQAPGKTLHFGEIWEIWDDTTIIMKGTDEGVVSLQNSKYRMNGVVEEASGSFTDYECRNVHMSGIIEWQNLGTEEDPIMAPQYAPGVFRVN